MKSLLHLFIVGGLACAASLAVAGERPRVEEVRQLRDAGETPFLGYTDLTTVSPVRGIVSDGKLIGYGTDIGPEAICYRADLFKKAGLPTDRVLVSLAGKSVRTELDASGRATVQLSDLGKSGKRTVTAWYAGSELLKSKTGKSSVKLKR